MNNNSSPDKPHRGIALITALLVTAIAAIIAANMASRQQLDIHRSRNLLAQEQAWAFAIGIEAWASQILTRDAGAGKTDHTGEDWAVSLPPLTVEGAVISGQLEDLQGRFNINNLLLDDGKPSSVDLARFRRLLESLGGDEKLANAVLDWLDDDESPHLPGGAEDTDYLIKNPPYRTANHLMSSPSELRLIDGFDTSLYEKLAPFLQALPERTAININTATAQVLMTLNNNITKSDAEQLIEQRGDQGFATVDEFKQLPFIKNLAQNLVGIAVNSDYFLLTADVALDSSRLQLHSILARNKEGHVNVQMRSQGGY